MKLKTLIDFCKKEEGRLLAFYSFKKEDFTLPCFVKINEELGELAEQVLVKRGIQRRKKLYNNKKKELGKELVDVIITLGILAQNLEVDMENEIKNGIMRRKRRKY